VCNLSYSPTPTRASMAYGPSFLTSDTLQLPKNRNDLRCNDLYFSTVVMAANMEKRSS